MAVVLALVLAQADKQDLKLELKRFDRLTVALSVQTEVAASDGRNSKHSVDVEILYECDKAEAGVILFDGYVQSAKASGTFRDRAFSYEWRKGGTAKTAGQKQPALASLEKPFKMKADARGVILESGLDEFLDSFPVFDPSALLGLPCPLGAGAEWKAEPKRYDWHSGFAVAYDVSAKDAALSAKIKYQPPDTEVPIEGMIQVKGSGDASGEFDLKTKRSLKGQFSARLSSDQGGLKREITQKAEWTVK